jgi:hypothetical protein
MLKPFAFEDGDLTYSCGIEQARPPRDGNWWWFTVSGDGQRYAPFEATTGDTRDSVRTRVVAFYTERLARRAAPYTRGPWGRPRTNVAAPAAAAAPADVAAAPAD